MKQQPRRCHSPNTKATKTGKQVSPEEIRAYIEDSLRLRQAEWHLQLLEDEQPDWSMLLGLHLQMSELERLEAGVEELF
jgi:hypothetical protein